MGLPGGENCGDYLAVSVFRDSAPVWRTNRQTDRMIVAYTTLV